jgi:hypothetical protein
VPIAGEIGERGVSTSRSSLTSFPQCWRGWLRNRALRDLCVWVGEVWERRSNDGI